MKGQLPQRLRELVEQVCRRILDMETTRGEAPTPATRPSQSLSSLSGAETLFRLFVALRGENLAVSPGYGDNGRPQTITRLLGITTPADQDTPESFSLLAHEAAIPDNLLLQLAMMSPEWVDYVQHTLGWPGLADAIWWIHAHVKGVFGYQSGVNDIRTAHLRQMSRRARIPFQEVAGGGVDAYWFREMYRTLGADRWEQVSSNMTHADSGYDRPEQFARAILGQLTVDSVAQRIRKGHQDSVLALGLLPLPEGEARQNAILQRYEIIQTFAKNSRSKGPERRANEKRVVELALDSLARTAGYPDRLRLEWAVEASAVQDLKEEIVVTEGEIQARLFLGIHGQPEIAFTKKGRPLKNLPPAVKKSRPDMATMLQRVKELEEQRRRMAARLEQMMCSGETFLAAELRELLGNPLLAAILSRLVLAGPELGYPDDDGRSLRNRAGNCIPLRGDESLRIAHPADLQTSGSWLEWQRECLATQRRQPFKQVFRELYRLTEAEREDGCRSRRFDRQRFRPAQGFAALAGRGWFYDHEAGLRRVDHAAGITADVTFDECLDQPSATEIATVRHVLFCLKATWQPMPLETVPPRLFSEVMRDVDLMISAGFTGEGVPPCDTATIEMRTQLVQSACTREGLANVRIEGRHAEIHGDLSDYTVHLGTGMIHCRPGGHVCVIPPQSDDTFLPFPGDDDLKTVEILSTIMTLAKDREIQDASVLKQIRGS